jgi:hypothetical protein
MQPQPALGGQPFHVARQGAPATRSSDGSHSNTGASLIVANRRLPPVDMTVIAPFAGAVVAER